LRELFAKVMKNNHDVDDGVYDWNALNGIYNPWLIQRVLTILPQVVVVGKPRQ
jgi:hypothetical protein